MENSRKLYHHPMQAAAAFRELYQEFKNSSALRRSCGVEQTVSQYCTRWYRLDQFYRQFCCSLAGPVKPSPASRCLREEIEQDYLNFQHVLNLNWHEQVLRLIEEKRRRIPDPEQARTLSLWDQTCSGIFPQCRFYHDVVAPACASSRVCVIISDGLRYEMGEELQRFLAHHPDCGDTKLKFNKGPGPGAMLAALPSYTQLGMAALLPHDTLEILYNGDVLADNGFSTSGIFYRSQMLKRVNPGSAALKLTSLQDREPAPGIRKKLQSCSLLYLWQNVIDSAGHHYDNEDPEAAEDSTDDPEEDAEAASEYAPESDPGPAVYEKINSAILKVFHYSNRKIRHFFITSDHGFLFQHSKPGATELIHAGPEALPGGKACPPLSRRFVLGWDLNPRPEIFDTFKPEDLGLEGDLEVQLPCNCQRLQPQNRDEGGCFAHGGCSLQEVVVPLIEITVLPQTRP